MEARARLSTDCGCDGRLNKIETVKVLLPIRPGKRPVDRSAMDVSGFFSTLMYTFLTPIFWKAHRQGITQETIKPLMSARDSVAINNKRFERLWRDEIASNGEQSGSLRRVFFRFVRTRVLLSAAIMLFALCIGYLLTSYVLYVAIEYLGSSSNSVGYSIALSCSLLTTTGTRVVSMNFGWYLNIRCGVRVKNAVLFAVYKKTTRLRNTCNLSVGEVVNICVNDIYRLNEATMFAPILVAFPLCILLILVGCVLVVGVLTTLTGTATLLLFFLFHAVLSKINVRVRRKCVVLTDRRTSFMNEVLNCVKLVKMCAWEELFIKNITEIRKHEQRYLRHSGYIICYSYGTVFIVISGVLLASVVSHWLAGNRITAAQAFTLMQLFGSLGSIMFILTSAVKPFTESIVAIKRIQPILFMEEGSCNWDLPSNPSHAVTIANASFKWESPPDKSARPTLNLDTGPRGTYVCIVDENGGEIETACADENNGGDSVNNLTESNASPPATVLKDISLVIPKSRLVGICGVAGSGKSSLLSCLLDQMNHLGGSVAIDGTFAYASQQPWIMNATIRDNILFGEPFDQERYNTAIYSCSLDRDLEIMTDGDRTEIGERGMSVSGGQKQRISLARAYYSNRDIYLLDDPLSAVDAHVGKHIFTHCIHAALREKTVLLVTHQLQYLQSTDYIVLIKDGTIFEQGTHDELLDTDGEYARLIDTFHSTPTEDDLEDDENGIVTEKEPRLHNGIRIQSKLGGSQENILKRKPEVAKLITEEDRGGGIVSLGTYRQFFRFAGGMWVVVGILMLTILSIFTTVSSGVWLALWIQQTTEKTSFNGTVSGNQSHVLGDDYSPYIDGSEDNNANSFIIIYMIFFASSLIVLGILGVTFVWTFIRAATRIHDSLLRKIMRCPISFFDTTPLGRILNRFSKDMDEVDALLPINMMRFVYFGVYSVIVQIVISVVLPYYLIVLAVGLPVGIFYCVIFRKGYCEIKRMDNTSRSMVVSHISTTMQGLATIKAYGQGERFAQRFQELLDINSHTGMLFKMAPRWVAVRVDVMSSIFVGALSLLILLGKETIFSPAVAAMALYMAVVVTGGLLQEIVVAATTTESSFISVERMLEYIEKTPTEADVYIKETKPPDTWPSSGDLKFKEVTMRYRPGLPLVLKGVTCHIHSTEKIGIVGRTGSGKSSLGVVLFRLVEPTSGQIVLDRVDIATIGLQELRSRLSIIPQDPVLFAGSIRFNLDPFNQHSEEELWAALEKTHIKQMISCLDQQLEAPVVENGENFSVGERQLMCMARVLLRKSKVLLMDEATAAIDTEMDSLIQQTIRQAFQDCTILIIAHRLNTVLDCDKIMVLDKGEILEFDKPDVLLATSGSYFSNILAAAKHNHGKLDSSNR